ncbi:PIN domain-containing protein [Raoultella ornithinolytica]|uniref:PIN domain-containing protein n=1 Tax=Raoultella ornithinolytica TaxID=54291 RepID=UPI000AC7BF9C|nr:PIN domain-containing protein [Raoultella ornithinolytica]
MELITRLVYIDTSAYERKHFQFGLYILEKLQSFASDSKVHVLVTDITRKEIEAHIQKKVEGALKELENFQKKHAPILRTSPKNIGQSLFNTPDLENITSDALASFSDFLGSVGVEEITTNNVSPLLVFEKYFTNAPPFDQPGKKKEFPDAFTLEAVNEIAVNRNHKVYIVSEDNDLISACNQNPNFIHLSSIQILIDLLLRNDEALEDMVAFADGVFNKIRPTIIDSIRQHIDEMEFIAESNECQDVEIDEVQLNDIKLTASNLTDVSRDSATYELSAAVTIDAVFRFPDYERSPWDPEDKAYAFVFESKSRLIFNELVNLNIEIGFHDGIRENAEIIDITLDDNYIVLDAEYGELLSRIDNYFDEDDEH